MSSTSVGGSIISGSEATTSSGGLGAGIDVSTLVSAAMADQEAELAVMQGQQTDLSNQQTALASFTTDVQALQSAAFTLTDPAGPLTDVVAASSNSTVLTASATPGASSGTHSIVVTSLATTSSAYSAELATGSTPLATGTLSIQVGAATAVPITVDNTNNTLGGLAETINNANIGVSASVITDANGSRLAIVSNTSGAPGNLTVSSSAGLPAFTQAVAGANAVLTVDGIPISSTSNTVTGTIQGVTLNLASPGAAVSISVGPDVTDQETAINNYVSAYNTVIGDLNTQFAINSTTGEQGPLATDSTIALTQTQILGSSAFAMSGNGAVNSLGDLGITMNDDGTLTVNSSQLEAALQSNPAAIQAFFQATTPGTFGTNLENSLTTVADPVTGALTQDANGLAQTQTDLTSQISDFEDQLNTTQTALTAEYDQVDSTLQELPLLLSQITSQLSSLSGA
ncbi:MAG: flagellar filament capping protein FliD [Candidatus Acidiferrales bacterium]